MEQYKVSEKEVAHMKTIDIDVPDKYGNILCMSLVGTDGCNTYVTTSAHNLNKYTHFTVIDDKIEPTDKGGGRDETD